MGCGAQLQLEVKGPFARRRYDFDKKGDALKGDHHNFAHLSYCRRGSLHAVVYVAATDASGAQIHVPQEILDPVTGQLVTRALPYYIVEKELDLLAGESLLIDAYKRHDFIALEDLSSLDCLYVHVNALGTILPRFDGFMPAYS